MLFRSLAFLGLLQSDRGFKEYQFHGFTSKENSPNTIEGGIQPVQLESDIIILGEESTDISLAAPTNITQSGSIPPTGILNEHIDTPTNAEGDTIISTIYNKQHTNNNFQRSGLLEKNSFVLLE